MILLGADPLSRFLNRAAETPFAWGRFDCLLWLADWIAEKRGVEMAADLRGSYSNVLQAARIVASARGMTALVEGRVKSAGLQRVAVGARGDIAVVNVAGDGGEHFGNEAGAILLGGTAALICQAGLVIADVPVVAVWKV